MLLLLLLLLLLLFIVAVVLVPDAVDVSIDPKGVVVVL